MSAVPGYPPTAPAASRIVVLPPIYPAPVRDFRIFDFTAPIKPATKAAITAASWSCTVDAQSEVVDPTPSGRLIGAPSFDTFTTTQLIGDCVDNCLYALSAQVTVTDGRILVLNGSLYCSGLPAVAILPDGALVFDYDEFVIKFPEFMPLSEELLAGYWAQAGMLFRNDATSSEQDPVIRREILDLLTAHCAVLFAPPPVGRGGGGSSALGGVLTSKSVNGVSVGSSGVFPGMSGTQAWYMLSSYGQKAWMMTRAYRTFHYLPGPQRFPSSNNPIWPFGPFNPYYWH
jgi:hypothetical protein